MDTPAFWSHVTAPNERGCWTWTASRDRNGYGRLNFLGRSRLAHRVAWILTHGAIPLGTPCVLHECDNPPCVNPDHLFLGTQADNIHDAVQKGRLVFGWGNIRKTHCPKGHPYDSRRDANGKRTCRVCMNARKREKRALLTGCPG